MSSRASIERAFVQGWNSYARGGTSPRDGLSVHVVCGYNWAAHVWAAGESVRVGDATSAMYARTYARHPGSLAALRAEYP